jgi:hypothetical protein
MFTQLTRSTYGGGEDLLYVPISPGAGSTEVGQGGWSGEEKWSLLKLCWVGGVHAWVKAVMEVSKLNVCKQTIFELKVDR